MDKSTKKKVAYVLSVGVIGSILVMLVPTLFK